MTKQVRGKYWLEFTFDEEGELPKNSKSLEDDLHEVLNDALFNYLEKKKVNPNEWHLIMCTNEVEVGDTEWL